MGGFSYLGFIKMNIYIINETSKENEIDVCVFDGQTYQYQPRYKAIVLGKLKNKIKEFVETQFTLNV